MRPHAAHPGLNTRAKVAIGLCAVLPMAIGILITVGAFHAAPAAQPQLLGHWVYVPSVGEAVHVDGRARRVDAQVAVGSASTGSQVVADQHAAYLVDYDHVITFDPGPGVTATAQAAGVAENPIPVEAAGTAYLVYRTSGLIMRLGPHPVTITAGGPLAAPAATPGGALWVYRNDTGALCLVGPTALNCPARAPTGHVGALAVRGNGPVFVDLTAGTWQPLDATGLGQPTKLGILLPQDAQVSTNTVDGQLAVIDPDGLRLYLISAQGVRTVPLGSGHFSTPVAASDAVAVVNTDTGTVLSFAANGTRRGSIPMAGGAITLTTGNDGLVYADSSDGLQTVIMADDGTLTPIHTTNRTPPSYQPPAPVAAISLPPATVATTTTESVPPAPNTITIGASPTSGALPDGTNPATGTDSPGTTTKKPTPTSPPPGPPPGSPVVDVLSATATGPTSATIQVRVNGDGPVFCHVFFNSVEYASTNCAGTMPITATGLPEHTLFDIYVIATNAKGTGIPGRRGVLQN
ncbi:MAG TPA: hypothetical protein VHZ97_01110 [Pseudonocardiaceae bacterium]|nr:hypothetical protein [Pseudonocardiaceae bacterium]